VSISGFLFLAVAWRFGRGYDLKRTFNCEKKELHMTLSSRISCAFAAFAVSGWICGCNNSPPASPPTVYPSHVEDHEGHGHDHAHDHSHADEGPNGGHLIELGNEEYHAEWLHDDDSGKLTVYILDAAAKKNVPISATSITIEKKIGDKADKYELLAIGRTDAEPKAAQFEITDKPLVEALKSAGQGVEASLSVDIEGKAFQGKFEHHEHGHHHGHKH
jgi:hypothetical protein